MKSLIAGCIRRPVSVGMFTVAACVFGFVALGRLPVNLLPEISYPTLTVETRMPGAAPIEVETLVTRPIEEAASVVPGLRRVTSRSRAGASEVTLEFVWDTNMDFAGLDVREKLDSVLLPEDAERPRLLRFDPASDAILRVGVSGDLPLAAIRQWTEEDLKKDLDAVDGVAAVRIEGGLVREIQVDVDEGRLAAYGISVAEVRDALAANNVNLAGGSVYEDEARYLVRTLNELDTLDRIRAVIVKDTDGRLVRLRDVAEVRSGFKDQEVILRQGGAEGVEVRIFKEGDANTVQVAEGVRSRLEALEESVPAGLALATLFDQSRFIEGAISEVVRNAWEGGLLAILVIALFLRDRRCTAVVAMAIPVSVIATFFVMQQMGLSLNIMSLGGLALGVGMLLDDSIVVLEAIHRRHAGGEGARSAAVSGTVEVAGPVIASTLTTVAVFLPIVFVEGVAGQLFRDQALTVSISILASLGFSLALIPVLSSRGVITPGAAGEQRTTTAVRALRGFRRGLRWLGRGLMYPLRPVASGFTAAEGAVARAYPPVLRAALRHPVTVFALAAGLFAGSLAVGRAGVGVELIPALAQGEFHFDVHLPEGSAVTATDTVVDAVGESALEDPAVHRVTTEAGTATGGGFAGGAGRAEHQGRIQVTMADPGDKLAEAAVIESIRAELAGQPGVRYEFGRPSYFSFRQPVEVEVYSEDRSLLVPSARRVQAAVADVPGLADVRSTAEAGSPEIRVHFAADRLASLGLTVDQASEGLRSKLRGEVATRLDEGDRRIDVMVRGGEGLRSRTAAVPELIVHAEEARLGAAAGARKRRGRRGARGAPPGRTAPGGGDLRQPRRHGPGGRHRGHRDPDRGTRTRPGRLHPVRRPARGDGTVLREPGARHRTRDLPRLFRDGEPVRVAAAPVPDPVHDPARGDRGGVGPPALRVHPERDRPDRGGDAGRNRGEERHRAGGLHQPAAPRGDGQGGSDRHGGPDPPAADPDDDADHHPGAHPDGARTRRGRRDPRSHGHHRHRRTAGLDAAHAGGDPDGVLGVRPQEVCGVRRAGQRSAGLQTGIARNAGETPIAAPRDGAASNGDSAVPVPAHDLDRHGGGSFAACGGDAALKSGAPMRTA